MTLPEWSSTTSVNINSSNEVIKILTNDSKKKVENASIIDVRMSDLECSLDARIAIGLHKYLNIVRSV